MDLCCFPYGTSEQQNPIEKGDIITMYEQKEMLRTMKRGLIVIRIINVIAITLACGGFLALLMFTGAMEEDTITWGTYVLASVASLAAFAFGGIILDQTDGICPRLEKRIHNLSRKIRMAEAARRARNTGNVIDLQAVRRDHTAMR